MIRKERQEVRVSQDGRGQLERGYILLVKDKTEGGVEKSGCG